MADESTTSSDDQAERAPKVKRPAYLSLDARVKDISSRDGTGEKEEYGGSVKDISSPDKTGEKEEYGGSEKGGGLNREGRGEKEENEGDEGGGGPNRDGEEDKKGREGDEGGDEPIRDDEGKREGEEEEGKGGKRIWNEGEEEERNDGDEGGGDVRDDDEVNVVGSKEGREETPQDGRGKGSGIKNDEGVIGNGGEFPGHGDKFWGKAPIRMSPAWHDAARDWHICSAITFLLFLMLISLVSIMDVLRNVMLIAFFVIFLGFLVVISGYFHIRAGTLYGYHAAYLPHKRNGIEFAEAFMEMASEKLLTEGKEIECVSGHTFGLLSVVKSLKFPDGEIVEINTFHVTGGMVTGLYLLVKAPWESAVWEVLEPLTKR